MCSPLLLTKNIRLTADLSIKNRASTHLQNSLPLGRLADALRIFLPLTIAPDFVHNL